MCAEGGDGQIEVLAFDLVAQRQRKGAFDELGIRSAAEASEGSVALVGIFGGAVFVEDGVVLEVGGDGQTGVS